jgi:hypothetical protein
MNAPRTASPAFPAEGRADTTGGILKLAVMAVGGGGGGAS